MNAYRLSLKDIWPEAIQKFSPAEIPFLFYHHGANSQLLNQIAVQIEKLNPDFKNALERQLNLQFITTPRDAQGNVCFADDPDLRPEFRTSFHPIDLWDYYYALWHSPIYWESAETRKEILPPPDQDLFWQRVGLGNKLRSIHSSRIRRRNYKFDLNFEGTIAIEPVRERFRPDEDPTLTGRLYLNDHQFIDYVPRKAWEYNIADRSFLPDFLSQFNGKTMDTNQIESLLDWIIVIDRTCRIQVGVF